ncbi:MAG: transglycosylase SLT domain-containing protein [Thermosynechococcaceae cyanobacterium]
MPPSSLHQPKRHCTIALAALLLLTASGTLNSCTSSDKTTEVQQTVSDEIVPLTTLPPTARTKQLQQLAEQGSKTSKNQAKYLLAADLVGQGQGGAALKYLKGLESQYPVLAGEILVLQAKAHTLAGQTKEAQKIWTEILKKKAKTPAAAEALYALGKQDPQYWDQVIDQFPSHPRAIDIAVERLKRNPVDIPLRLLIAKYGQWHPDYGRYLNRLTTEFRGKLKPEDWETIAFAYWDRQIYKEAGLAYAKATPSSLTAFRAARGLQLGGEKAEAIAAYQKMITNYPDAEETATALLKLSELQENATGLDRAFKLATQNKEDHRAGQILQTKARLLKKQGGATEIEKQLLTDYGTTEAAAELRWEQAQAKAKAKDLGTARDWALRLQSQNPNSELAAQAAFWAGKWGKAVGQSPAMPEASQWLWKNHPESYYAWRAASDAGWQVGTFSTLRFLQPQVTPTQTRLPLPAGSEAVQELYQLGQSKAAYERWQWEFTNRDQRTFEEQLTDGLLRIEVGDSLRGMFMLLNLFYRAQEEPEQRELYQKWRQDPKFWQALYPLKYFQETSKWAKQRNLNSLLVLGLIRQESRFQTEIRSSAGAVGLMQVLPSTGKETARRVGLQDYKLTNVDDNINLGTGYFDFVHRQYDNNSMLAIASYNAGPGAVAKWLRERPKDDVDEFIEAIPFPETNYYVRVVLENHWNYLRLYNPEIAQQLQQQS